MTHQGQSWMGTVFLRQHGPHKHQQNKESWRAGCLQLCQDCSRDSATVSLVLLFHPNHTFKKKKWGYHGCLYGFLGSGKYTFPCHSFKSYVDTETCTQMFRALFRITRNWRQPTCPSVGEWINSGTYRQWNIIQ